MIRGDEGSIKLLRRDVFVTQFRKILKEGGGNQDFASKSFCITAESFHSVSFSVSLVSAIEKVWIRGGREYQGFPSKNCCLTVPKNFLQEPFRVSLILGIENFYALEGYVTIFLSNFFV